jgi:hypothetical protein
MKATLTGLYAAVSSAGLVPAGGKPINPPLELPAASMSLFASCRPDLLREVHGGRHSRGFGGSKLSIIIIPIEVAEGGAGLLAEGFANGLASPLRFWPLGVPVNG